MKITNHACLGMLSAGLITLVGCTQKNEIKQSTLPAKVTVTTVASIDSQQMLSYSGTIEPDNTAQVGFSVAGTVNRIMVNEGQHVVKGQLLAGIDATEYTYALSIAKAGLEQTEDLYRRFDELYKKGSLPEKDYMDIKTRLAQARANKGINEKHIADSKLYSPMTGIIAAKMIENGSAAAPGVAAFTIVRTDQVYARIAVPESEVGAMKNGMIARITIPTLNQQLNGTITIINPLADPTSKTFSVKIRLDNPKGTLLPGMIADIRIGTSRNTSAITIPIESVVHDADNLAYVFTVNGQNRAIRKRIGTGGLSDRSILVTNGLQAGDRIIVSGQDNIKDGQKVGL